MWNAVRMRVRTSPMARLTQNGGNRRPPGNEVVRSWRPTGARAKGSRTVRGNSDLTLVLVIALVLALCMVLGHCPKQTSYFIFVRNKCSISAKFGVRYTRLDGSVQQDEWWELPDNSESFLKIDGRRVVTISDRVDFVVRGNEGGEYGAPYAGKRRWMHPAKTRYGDVYVKLPCDRKPRKKTGRPRPGLP